MITENKLIGSVLIVKKGNKNKFVTEETLKIRKDMISRMIDSAIEEINIEVESHKNGRGTDGTIPILLQIQEELCKMKNVLSPQKFIPTYNYIIRDSWNEFLNMGEKLLKIAQDYNEKLY